MIQDWALLVECGYALRARKAIQSRWRSRLKPRSYGKPVVGTSAIHRSSWRPTSLAYQARSWAMASRLSGPGPSRERWTAGRGGP